MSMAYQPTYQIDPVCLFHGKKASEHICLYCCLCFDTLTLEQCFINEQNRREDVCKKCAEQERKYAESAERRT